MRRVFRDLSLLFAALLFIPTLISCNRQPSGGVEEAVSIASDAYLYGFPLVIMDMTRKQTTNVDSAGPQRAPTGQLIRIMSLPESFATWARKQIENGRKATISA